MSVHAYLRPLLIEIVSRRLAARGQTLDRMPETVGRKMLGDRLWDIVRPGRPFPEDRHGPGVSPSDLGAMLEVAPEDLEWADGRWSVRGDPDQGKAIGEIAFAAFAAHDLPDGVEPSLDSDATYDPDNFSFPHGTHLCAVEIDTETGWVHIRSYVAVDDVGVVVNPQIVEGQVHGGIAQGIAQALYEEAAYDSSGNLITATLADYLVPSAADLPSITTARTTTPSTLNPLGVKGVGEAGTIASTPAVVNAIIDALRPLGVTDVPMPCTPERVWRAIQEARGGAR